MVIPGALNITYFIIMRNYYSYSVPKSLEEAALLDGCTDIGVFFRIVIPVSRSMLAAIALFIAVINWNDYYNYMMFISNKTNLQPFAWILRRMLVDQTMMNQVRNGGRGHGPAASAAHGAAHGDHYLRHGAHHVRVSVPAEIFYQRHHAGSR